MALMAAAAVLAWWFWQNQREREVLRQMIVRLTAEERVAEVWAERRGQDERGRPRLRLKILEYDTSGKALEPVYCEFSANDVIHFEALVIRLDDEVVMEGKGKSIHLFRRAFALDDSGNTYQSCDLNRPLEVPGGYRISGDRFAEEVQRRYWERFWMYALDEKSRAADRVKNAQIEAPGSRFLPEKIYRLILERDGGLRIEARDIPEILKGESIGR